MTVAEATDFIKPAGIDNTQPSVWADLGCGDGIFTQALANLLAPESKIIAVDQKATLRSIRQASVEIEFRRANFVTEISKLPLLNGIVMANSLHYVADQPAMMKLLKKQLLMGGMLLFVEYDTDRANQWVPYPVSLSKLNGLIRDEGLIASKVSQRPSVYNSARMYVCTGREGIRILEDIT